MRILYLDIDSLRPDHLGCYGYRRETSPNIDRLARFGVRFENCYASDVPCGPSRNALFSGRFGTHTGVIGHTGTVGEMRNRGPDAPFNSEQDERFRSLPGVLRHSADHRTATITPFPSNHDNWHFLHGFQDWECTRNDSPEHDGLPIADTTADAALEWLDSHGEEDDWFLHVNFWDPHRPYDAPDSFGNPFADDPAPEWPPQDVLDRQNEAASSGVGARGRYEIADVEMGHRAPEAIATREQFRTLMDGYDTGIRYADHHVGRLLDALQSMGVYEDTLVIVSADHGENFGELDVYTTHVTADDCTCNVPLIVSGPGVDSGVDEELHYQLDLAPTLAEHAGADIPSGWDGRSFRETVTDRTPAGRDYLVCTTGWVSTQRSVRWDDWLLIETYDRGALDPEIDSLLLFDLEADPHETENLAGDRPDLVDAGKARLHDWERTVGTQAARGEAGGLQSNPAGIVDPVFEHLRETDPATPQDRPTRYDP